MTWRNLDTGPLTWHERDNAYVVQCGLRAIKQCQMCGDWFGVAEFGGYGVQPCGDCDRQLRRKRRAHW